MYPSHSIRSLPLPLLLALSLVFPSTSTATPDPLVRRDEAEFMERIPRHAPAAVKKMSVDEGEKFFFDYWSFTDIEEEQRSWGNASSPRGGVPPKLPLLLHSDDSSQSLRGRGFFNFNFNLPRASKRGFQCPTGTSSCDSINRPNSCCPQGDTCQLIPDSGLGDVGCCASGDECEGGTVGNCEDGYTSCPNNPGGGCCIPGYECKGEGCVIVRTETITLRPTKTRTETQTQTQPTTTTTTTEPETQSTTTTCGPDCSSTTQTIAPPVRPTTNPPPTTSTSTSHPSSCPTGFYACSAVYQGGCCRIGRDCQSTSCPTPSSTTIVNEDGKTIVVPATGPAATEPGPSATGSCAEGWFSCGREDGGGCCPEGFGCGTESCTATATGGGMPTGEVGKVPAEGGAGKMAGCGSGLWLLAFGVVGLDLMY